MFTAIANSVSRRFERRSSTGGLRQRYIHAVGKKNTITLQEWGYILATSGNSVTENNCKSSPEGWSLEIAVATGCRISVGRSKEQNLRMTCEIHLNLVTGPTEVYVSVFLCNVM